MLHLALRGVRNNTGRYIATLVAIITGVAFFAATGFISDGIIRSLEGDAVRQYGNVDVAVVVADTSAANAESLTVPGATADQILAVDGVETGGGVVTGPVAFLAADGSTFGDGTTGRLWIADEELNPLDLVDGTAPNQADEVVIDKGTAAKHDLTVGSSVTVLTSGGQFPATVTGISKFGSKDSVDGNGTVSIPEAAVFDWLRRGIVEYDEYYLRTSGDTTVVAESVGAVVPDGFEAQTGEDFLADKRSEAGAFGNFLRTGLQAFALLALFVGAFVIYNTFSVIVAQRQRELAVLSAIGATPKQIKRSLRFEGLIVGLVGSVLGVVVGLLLAQLLRVVVDAVGVSLPGGGIVVGAPNVIGSILMGTLITLFSVMIPARRAARIEPIEAFRDAQAEVGRASVGRGVTAAVLIVLGLVAMLLGSAPVLIGVGAFLLIVGVLVAGPYIAIIGSRILRPVFGRLGLEGRLAVDNSVRNPNRTATTANALLIGVFLVTFVTVAGTSLKDYVVAELQKLEAADFTISSDGGTLDDALVAQIQAVDGVQQVTTYRREAVALNGEPGLISTADTGALLEVTGIKADDGSLDDLVDGTIAITPQGGQTFAIGDTVTVTSAHGETADLRVVAVLETGIDVSNIGGLVTTPTFDALVGETAPTAGFIDTASGDQSATKDAIEEAVATRPDVSILAGNAIGKLIGGVFDFMINAVNGLLVMSVLVALIGIVNTLSLSILERRHELGLLRIMGMTDRRVQRMVRLESALIAALGTIAGMGLGLALGYGMIAAIDRLSDAGIALGFPLVPLLVVFVLGVALGVVASWVPSRRSTHLEVLEAIQAT